MIYHRCAYLFLLSLLDWPAELCELSCVVASEGPVRGAGRWWNCDGSGRPLRLTDPVIDAEVAQDSK